jgi:hypothetical protein
MSLFIVQLAIDQCLFFFFNNGFEFFLKIFSQNISLLFLSTADDGRISFFVKFLSQKKIENMCTGSCKQKSEVPVETMFTYIFNYFFFQKTHTNLHVRGNIIGKRV